MYQRLYVQRRVSDFLEWVKERNWKNIRVSPGHMITPYLENYEKYISNTNVLKQAIAESEIKEEGVATSINFNISSEAGRKLLELKGILDERTQRHLYPAQVLDILLLCVKLGEDTIKNKEDVSDKELAVFLLDFVQDLISGVDMSVKKIAVKDKIIKVLLENNVI